MCAGAADVAELVDADAVSEAGANRLAPPPAGLSGRVFAGAAAECPARALTLTRKPILGAKPAAALLAAEWAVRGGVRDLDEDFERLRPNLAHRFNFELDRFQKEAIVHLEQVRSRVGHAGADSAVEVLLRWFLLSQVPRHAATTRTVRKVCQWVQPCLKYGQTPLGAASHDINSRITPTRAV